MSFATNSQGGEYKHKLVISEMPKHDHGIAISSEDHAESNNCDVINTKWSNKYIEHNNSMYKTGGDTPHNNIQPYTTVFFWKRIN